MASNLPYILSETIRKVEELEGRFDAIFCGKQAIDGDTAQVGPEIAEHLNYPQVTYCLLYTSPPVQAGAAQVPLLHQHGLFAQLGGADGGDIAAGAAADDRNFILSHACSSCHS